MAFLCLGTYWRKRTQEVMWKWEGGTQLDPPPHEAESAPQLETAAPTTRHDPSDYLTCYGCGMFVEDGRHLFCTGCGQRLQSTRPTSACVVSAPRAQEAVPQRASSSSEAPAVFGEGAEWDPDSFPEVQQDVRVQKYNGADEDPFNMPPEEWWDGEGAGSVPNPELERCRPLQGQWSVQ